jgi:hypothetical protein
VNGPFANAPQELGRLINGIEFVQIHRFFSFEKHPDTCTLIMVQKHGTQWKNDNGQ